jgi:hypothetical protein
MCPAVLLTQNFATTTTITFKTCRARIQHCYVAVLYYWCRFSIKLGLERLRSKWGSRNSKHVRSWWQLKPALWRLTSDVRGSVSSLSPPGKAVSAFIRSRGTQKLKNSSIFGFGKAQEHECAFLSDYRITYFHRATVSAMWQRIARD